MKLTGQTYSYYSAIEYLPPLIFLVLSMALTLLLIPVQLMLNRSLKLKRHCNTQFLVEHVFSTMLNKRKDRAGKKVYTTMSYKVPDRYNILMLAMVLALMGIAAVVFWDYFLFEKSHHCNTDPNFACFPACPSFTTPCLDCSDTSYLKDNNITSVICYRLVYNLSIAAGTALGVVAMYALLIIVITLLLLKVSNGSRWNKHRAVLTVAIQIITVVITLGTLIPTYIYHKTISYTNEKLIIRIMTNGFMTYTVIYSTVLFPWWSFIKIKDDQEEDNQENDEEANGEYRRIRGTSIPI